MNMAIIVLIAFVIAIAVGFKTGINQGIISMVISYFIGCFAMGLAPKELVAMWPLKIFFILVFVSLFYNFASVNGTMDKIALNVLYKFSKQTRVLPFVVYVAAAVICAMGAGPFVVVVTFCPILFSICDKMNMSKTMFGISAYLGAAAMGPWPTCSTGALINGLVADAGYQEEAMAISFTAVIFAFLGYLLAFTLLYFFVFKGYKAAAVDVTIEKPEPYNDKQKKSLVLIILFMLVLLIPNILGLLFDNALVNVLLKYNDVAFTAIVFVGISYALDLADKKKVMAAVPWNTVVLVGGISIIVGLAVEAGTIDMLANMVNSAGNKGIVPGLISLIASSMSLFSSTSGVVVPTLVPIVPSISATAGVSPALLVAALVHGSGIVGFSPFSTSGALIMGCTKDSDAKKMFKELLQMAAVCWVYTFVLFVIIGFIV